MLGNMFPHFSHGLTDGDVVVEKLAVSSSLPFGEGGKLLRDSMEETDDDADRSCLHVVAELGDSSGVGYTVMAIKLHLFPDSEEDGGDHEDRRPVLQTITAVHTGVERRQLLEDFLLQLSPHIG